MIDPNYLCPGCMRQRKSLDDSCPYCGFEAKEYRETVSARVLSPRTILAGKYMLGKVLGEGGFGITYLAWDLNREQRIAIKEYFPAGLVTRDTANAQTEQISVISGSKKVYYEHGLQSFKEEAKNLASLWNVESVVSVRDFFFENETAYLVMEYLDGQNLKQYLGAAPEKRIDAKEALHLMLPIMEALSALHNMGVIHRDISPENIIITGEGKVKLIDFGAARVAVGRETQSLTVLLKHGYAPVEQYQTRGKQGAWTDIYALCATLYRMISGITPEPSIDRMAEDKMESLYELSQKIPDIEVTKGVSDAIQKGLALKKEERWQKVEELKTALGLNVEKKKEEKSQNNNDQKSVAKQPAIVKEDRIPVESQPAIVKEDRIPVEPQTAIVKENKISVESQPEKRDKKRLALKIAIGICAICAVVLVGRSYVERPYNKYETVREHEKIASASDEEKQAYYEKKGKDALRAEDYESAEEYYKQSLDINPNVENFMKLAEIYENQDKMGEFMLLWNQYKDSWAEIQDTMKTKEKKKGEQYLRNAVLAARAHNLEWIPIVEGYAEYMDPFSNLFHKNATRRERGLYQQYYLEMLNSVIAKGSENGIAIDKLTELQNCYSKYKSFTSIKLEIMRCYEANLGITQKICELILAAKYDELETYLRNLDVNYKPEENIYYRNGVILDNTGGGVNGVGMIWKSTEPVGLYYCVYYGDIEYGKPNGNGIMFYVGGSRWSSIHGEMKNGKADGQCVYTGFFSDGKTRYSYAGNFTPGDDGDSSYPNGTMTAEWQGNKGTFQANMGTREILWTEGDKKIYVQDVHSKAYIYNTGDGKEYVKNYFK